MPKTGQLLEGNEFKWCYGKNQGANMQILEIRGKKWAVGVEWEILAGESTAKQEAKEIASKTAHNYGVIVDYDVMTSVGLVKKQPPKAPSAALYLALANQEHRTQVSTTETFLDWIVLEDIGDDKYWMAVIKSGIPAPQFDAIFDITTVKDKITELLINDTYQIYSKSTEVSSLFEGIKEINAFSLNELTEDVKTKNSFVKLRGIPNYVIFGSIATMVTIGILAIGVSFLEGRSLAEKRANLQEKLQEEEVKRQLLYESEVAIHNKAVESNRSVAYERTLNKIRGNPNIILNAWYNAVAEVGLGTHGWTLNTIECYYNIESGAVLNRFACDFLYKRTGLSTNRMLLEDFPHAQIKGDQAIVTFNVPIEQEALTYTVVNSLSDLRGVNDWNFNMVSQLQLLKIADIEHKIEPSSDITFEVPPTPVSPAQQQQGISIGVPQQVSLGVSTGNVLISGDSFELIREIADNVDFYGLALRRVTFEVKELGVINWEATFNYFVKNTGGSIGGSDSGKLSNVSVREESQQEVQADNVTGQNVIRTR